MILVKGHHNGLTATWNAQAYPPDLTKPVPQSFPQANHANYRYLALYEAEPDVKQKAIHPESLMLTFNGMRTFDAQYTLSTTSKVFTEEFTVFSKTWKEKAQTKSNQLQRREHEQTAMMRASTMVARPHAQGVDYDANAGQRSWRQYIGQRTLSD